MPATASEKLAAYARQYQHRVIASLRCKDVELTLAEDLTQETFRKAYEILTEQPTTELNFSWFRETAKNKWLDHIRRPTNRTKALPAEIDIARSEEDSLEAAERVARLKEAIGKLPQQHREWLNLFMEGHNGNEIAETMNVSASRVAGLKKETIEMLKKSLVEQ